MSHSPTGTITRWSSLAVSDSMKEPEGGSKVERNNKTDDIQRRELEGSALTEEQFEDVYMAGTSDGVVQLQEDEVQVEHKPFDQ